MINKHSCFSTTTQIKLSQDLLDALSSFPPLNLHCHAYIFWKSGNIKLIKTPSRRPWAPMFKGGRSSVAAERLCSVPHWASLSSATSRRQMATVLPLFPACHSIIFNKNHTGKESCSQWEFEIPTTCTFQRKLYVAAARTLSLFLVKNRLTS